MAQNLFKVNVSIFELFHSDLEPRRILTIFLLIEFNFSLYYIELFQIEDEYLIM